MASYTEVINLIDNNLPDNPAPLVKTAKHREVEKAIVDYANNVVKMVGVSGSVITNEGMMNRDIGAIIINDFAINSGFTKNLPENFLTLTDAVLAGGETITLFLI